MIRILIMSVMPLVRSHDGFGGIYRDCGLIVDIINRTSGVGPSYAELGRTRGDLWRSAALQGPGDEKDEDNHESNLNPQIVLTEYLEEHIVDFSSLLGVSGCFGDSVPG